MSHHKSTAPPSAATAENPSLTVAVPVYNNAGSLPLLHERLISALDSTGLAHKIIYVNDGSTDASYDFLVGLCGKGQPVKVVDLEQNFGQSAAILAAMSVATGDIVVTIDADLENHPEDIPALVTEVRKGAELACGVRGRRQASLFTRRGPSWFANRLVGRALSIDLKDWGCGLNAVTSEITQQILTQDPLPTLPKIEAALLSSRISQVPVAYSERQHGRSGYTVWRLCGFAAAFFRSYSVSRTASRLFGRSTVQDNPIPGASTDSSLFPTAQTTPTPMAVVSWMVLTSAAVLVRFGLLLTGSLSRTERFRIREVLD